ncbi:MAG TPA: Ku protein [Chloroflexota bacterium]
MPARAIWSGAITLSLLSIPVKLYAATESKDLAFNTLHSQCSSRLNQKRWCATCDREVPSEETERAYQWSKGVYVPVSDDDLASVAVESAHTIDLKQFAGAEEFDPVYFEKAYWLEPDKIGVGPYNLLYRALQERNVYGIGTVTLRTKERLVALRAGGGPQPALMLDTLFYPDEIRERAALSMPAVDARQLEVALQLVDAKTEPFVPADNVDTYRDALLALITAKQSGQAIVAPIATAKPEAGIPDLMSMLQAAVADAQTKARPDAIQPKRKKGAA